MAEATTDDGPALATAIAAAIWNQLVEGVELPDGRTARVVFDPEPTTTEGEAALWIDPARRSGFVCLTGSRIDTEMVAEYVWNGNYERLRKDWGYLTPRQILVACWWEGQYGAKVLREAWEGWVDEAHEILRSGGGLPPLPPTQAEVLAS